jgi:hypothetical protein
MEVEMEYILGSRKYIPKRKTSPASASAAAVTGNCIFYGIMVRTDGTNNVTLNLYDNTGASGTLILPSSLVIDGSARIASIGDDSGLPITNGIYVDVTCAGTCSYQVYYDND